jgi:hypothetical protein
MKGLVVVFHIGVQVRFGTAKYRKAEDNNNHTGICAII